MQTAQWQAVYLHGKGGNAREAEHYRALLPGWRVTGLDYRAQTPWEAREEFLAYFKAARRDGTKVLVIANSIGAFFAMQALDETRVDRALFVSPVVDMERLIETMMAGEGITEPELRQRARSRRNLVRLCPGGICRMYGSTRSGGGCPPRFCTAAATPSCPAKRWKPLPGAPARPSP
mgnify:CR=1 FL=1